MTTWTIETESKQLTGDYTYDRIMMREVREL
jgi:hypothetical protein